MFAGALLAAATAATAISSWLLPASPQAYAVGDIDGDQQNELVILLVWPSWSSKAVNRSPEPSVYEIEVTPAIEDRRELWAFRWEDGRLKRAAEPLRVGRELLAIAPRGPAGPVIALDNDGLLRIELDSSDAEVRRLKLVRFADGTPVIAGADTPLRRFPGLWTATGGGAASAVLPTARGVTLVGPDGKRTEIDSPFRDVVSGASASLRIAFPRRIDLDRDGRTDLLYIDWNEQRAALRRGLAGGGFAEPEVWDLRPIIAPPRTAAELAAEDAQRRKNPKGSPPQRWLVDVLDTDQDGTLEAVIHFEPAHKGGIRGELKSMHATGELRLYPLRPAGVVDAAPASSFEVVGETATFDHPEFWPSPFRDLDGDGRPELIQMEFKIGLFGVAKALVTKKANIGVVLHVYRREASAWSEVSDAAPKFDLSIDLSGFELSRFFRLPGDLDGDGRVDLVLWNGAEVEIYAGLTGGRFARKPRQTIQLLDPIRTFEPNLAFIDLNGDGKPEMLAFELQAKEEDKPAQAVRMELHVLEAVQ